MTRNKRSRLIVNLIREQTTKLGALDRGWLYAPSDREIAFWDQFDWDVLMRTAPEARAGVKPAHRPWMPRVEVPRMTSALRDRLKKHARRALGG